VLYYVENSILMGKRGEKIELEKNFLTQLVNFTSQQTPQMPKIRFTQIFIYLIINNIQFLSAMCSPKLFVLFANSFFCIIFAAENCINV
jgi:hypothetical protein